MHPELDIGELGKFGGKRPNAGRPKGTTAEVMAARRSQGIAKLRFIPQKRERELWMQAVDLAIETRNVDALIKILIAAGQFHYGKPYEAINPGAARRPKDADSRLLMAIQNLQIVSQSPSQTSQSQAVDSKAICELPSDCQSLSSASDIEVEQTAGKSSADR